MSDASASNSSSYPRARAGWQLRQWAHRATRSGVLWIFFGLLCITIVVLGTVGFTRYQTSVGDVEPLASRFYRSVQLFVLESGSVSGEVPWQLNVARFAAPLLAAYAVVVAVVLVFQDQFVALRLRLTRHHIVIFGAGAKGSRLAQALLSAGDRVVVVDIDPTNENLPPLRTAGALVAVGDARAARTLSRAGVERARRLAVLCGDDGINTQVVAAVRQLSPRRPGGEPACVAHIADPELCELLCVDEFGRYGTETLRVEFVNLNAVAVQALLRHHPPGTPDGPTPRVLVLGAGTTARQVTCALSRTWALMPGHNADERLLLQWVAPDSPASQVWRASHPEIDQCTDLRLIPDLDRALDGSAPDIAYVCPDNDSAATETALRLRALLAGQATSIVIVLTTVEGLGELLRSSAHPPGTPPVVTFGVLDETCQPEVLLTGTSELLAQAIHRLYLDAHGPRASTEDPALRPWEELPESLRESNRDHAAHIAVKLAAVGLTMGPLVDWTTAQQPFSEDEAETMARLEHDRWVSERRAAGWRPGPREPEQRTTPYLVPWEELSEELRDQDRLFIRALPGLLASVGLQVLRPSTVLDRCRVRRPETLHNCENSAGEKDMNTREDNASQQGTGSP